ncbi:MAG: sulfatase [Candidatus Aminicenantales bacterium]
MRYTDERFIGGLVDGLKELGLYERALIVFTSDHGEEFYEHKGWGHGHSLYDESLKVPLIIKFPGGEYRGRRVESIVSLVDVFPTILDFLNLSDPQGLRDGRSLLPLIEGKEQGDRTFVADVASDVLHSRIPQKTAMNDGRLKLILNAPFPPEARDYFLAPPPLVDAVEVFDIEKDPGETTNIRDTTPNISRRIIRAIEKMYREAEKRNIQKLKMGEELKKQLKALGYIGRIS